MYQMTPDDIINVLITDPYKRNPNYDDSDLVAAAKEIHKDPEKWDDFKFKFKCANEDYGVNAYPFFAKVERPTEKEDDEIDWDDILPAFSDIEEEEIEWLVPNIIPKGCITILAGAGDMGKSTIYASLAAAISSGGRCILHADVPEEFTGDDPKRALILTTEDRPGAVIKAKLRDNNANQDIIRVSRFKLDKNGKVKVDWSFTGETLIKAIRKSQRRYIAAFVHIDEHGFNQDRHIISIIGDEEWK